MPEVIFEINRDLSVPMSQQAVPGHNRWHRDIPPAATLRPGASYRIECKDWTDNQIRNDDSATDIRDMDIDPCQVLSGPLGRRARCGTAPHGCWIGCGRTQS